MGTQPKRLLVIQIAGLGYDFLQAQQGTSWRDLTFKPVQSVFPAVTCTAQASMRTGSAPSRHGVVGNGFLDHHLNRPLFWEQSSRLVRGPRIWDTFRQADRTVAMVCWQQSMGEPVDILLTPAPIHKHHGGMIQDCYCRPADLYPRLQATLGRGFDLKHYWGPMASYKSSQWIAEATACLLRQPEWQPDLCLTYLPVLDYDLQRFGPDHPRSRRALEQLWDELALLYDAANANGYELVCFGDYAIAACPHGAVYPNRLLRDAGLLSVREIRGMLYPDYPMTRSFAVVDHEVAHVYVADRSDRQVVADALIRSPGVERVLDKHEQVECGLDHERSGDWVAVAADGYWFAYPWWTDPARAPEFAGHVDIHNKPGYDPCELFWGWPPGSVSRDTNKVKGSHGRVGPDRATCWAGTCLTGEPNTLLDLADDIQSWLNQRTP